MAAPQYVAGIDFSPEVRQDAFDVMGRLVEHYRNKTTDRVEHQWREPVRAYRDQKLWEREMAAVHGKVPLPLALSCELPGPGTYKSIDVAGTPVLITRDAAGEFDRIGAVPAYLQKTAALVLFGTGDGAAA